MNYLQVLKAVVPAKAGTHGVALVESHWAPAFAGATVRNCSTYGFVGATVRVGASMKSSSTPPNVVPAQAGTQRLALAGSHWAPAFAGATVRNCSTYGFVGATVHGGTSMKSSSTLPNVVPAQAGTQRLALVESHSTPAFAGATAGFDFAGASELRLAA
jgi:hypothetical protein